MDFNLSLQNRARQEKRGLGIYTGWVEGEL